MTVSVRIPSQIGRVFGATTWEQIEAETVSSLIVALDVRFPGLAERLIEPHGEMRRWINVFVDGEDIRVLGGMDTALRPDAEIYIVPSVAGGL